VTTRVTTRVIVVDDHAAVRASLAAFIDASGDLHVVGEARDGCEALDLVTELAPQVVLMDVRMPRLDGIETTRRLKERPSPPRVVLISAYEEDDLEQAGRDAGADAFLLKGTRGDAVVQRLRDVAAL
jgi:DNA-binding NarL/FixJ family response regulator